MVMYNAAIVKSVFVNMFRQYNVKYNLSRNTNDYIRFTFSHFDIEIWNDYTYVIYDNIDDKEVAISSYNLFELRRTAGMIAFLQGPSDER